MLNAAVIGIYLSFALDLLVWPIPSEASAGALMKTKGWLRSTKGLLLSGLSFLSLAFVVAIPVLAVIQLTDGANPLGTSQLPGIIIAITGRLVSLAGTRALRARESPQLAQDRIFRFSRNPISLGMHLTFFGLVLVYNIWYLWMGLLFFVLHIHLKILLEERHLHAKHGSDYEDYRRSTPRYLVL